MKNCNRKIETYLHPPNLDKQSSLLFTPCYIRLNLIRGDSTLLFRTGEFHLSQQKRSVLE